MLCLALAGLSYSRSHPSIDMHRHSSAGCILQIGEMECRRRRERDRPSCSLLMLLGSPPEVFAAANDKLLAEPHWQSSAYPPLLRTYQDNNNTLTYGNRQGNLIRSARDFADARSDTDRPPHGEPQAHPPQSQTWFHYREDDREITALSSIVPKMVALDTKATTYRARTLLV
jgi:hypothetical protein